MTREPEHRTTTSDDFLVSAEDKTSTAWRDFTRAMEGRTYGPQETLDAWLWFKEGCRPVKHTLVVVGYIGCKRAYLDVSREEAVRRYRESEHEDEVDLRRVKEIEFTDEFRAYDVWEP